MGASATMTCCTYLMDFESISSGRLGAELKSTEEEKSENVTFVGNFNLHSLKANADPGTAVRLRVSGWQLLEVRTVPSTSSLFRWINVKDLAIIYGVLALVIKAIDIHHPTGYSNMYVCPPMK